MKHTSNKIYSLLLLLAAVNLVFQSPINAQTEDDYKLLKQANSDYANGKFQDAVEKYETLVNSGLSAAELYYNLGNAYYRVGDYKSAILNYERAKLLDPDNEDILINLEYSQRYVQDKIETVPKFFLLKWGEGFVNMFSEKGWAIISITSFILLLVGIVLFLFTKVIVIRKLSFYIGILTIFISLISFYCSYQQKQELANNNNAIVFSPSVTVKSAPNESGTDLFIIHEGLKVTIIGESKGWKEIKLSDGKVGWLPDESIEPI